MPKLFVLALAGAAGTLARYGLGLSVHRFARGPFPAGTLLVNLIGCLFIGLVSMVCRTSPGQGTDYRTILGVGLAGGFTTFSAFGLETLDLLRKGTPGLAAINVGVSVGGGLAAVWLGAIAGRVFGS